MLASLIHSHVAVLNPHLTAQPELYACPIYRGSFNRVTQGYSAERKTEKNMKQQTLTTCDMLPPHGQLRIELIQAAAHCTEEQANTAKTGNVTSAHKRHGGRRGSTTTLDRAVRWHGAP